MKIVNLVCVAFGLFFLGCGKKDESPKGSVPGKPSESSTPNGDSPKTLAGLSSKEGATLEGPNTTIWAVAFSPDGKTLASGGYEKFYLWDLATGTQKGILKGHRNRITALAFSPDGKTLASAGGEDQMIKFWDVEKQEEKGTLEKVFTHAMLSFTPDGKTLCGSGSMRWEVETRKPLPRVFENYAFYAYSAGGESVGASSSNREGDFASVIEIATGKKLADFPKFGGKLIGVSSPAKTVLCQEDKTDKLSLWDFSGKKRAELDGKLSGLFVAIAFTPDGKYLVGSMDDEKFRGLLKVWDVATGKDLATLKGEKDFHSVAFSNDSKLLAAGDGRGQIKLWTLDVIVNK